MAVTSKSHGNWSGRRDLHLRYPAPKAGVLAATLRPDGNEIGAASWDCTTSDSEVARVTVGVASLTIYCRIGNWKQRSELHRRRLAYETGLNSDSPCDDRNWQAGWVSRPHWRGLESRALLVCHRPVVLSEWGSETMENEAWSLLSNFLTHSLSPKNN